MKKRYCKACGELSTTPDSCSECGARLGLAALRPASRSRAGDAIEVDADGIPIHLKLEPGRSVPFDLRCTDCHAILTSPYVCKACGKPVPPPTRRRDTSARAAAQFDAEPEPPVALVEILPLCPSCGASSRSLKVCTECGKPLPSPGTAESGGTSTGQLPVPAIRAVSAAPVAAMPPMPAPRDGPVAFATGSDTVRDPRPGATSGTVGSPHSLSQGDIERLTAMDQGVRSRRQRSQLRRALTVLGVIAVVVLTMYVMRGRLG